MRLHSVLEIMPRTEHVQIEEHDNKLLFRGMAIKALKQLEDREVFTFFSIGDYEHGSVLCISLEEDSND